MYRIMYIYNEKLYDDKITDFYRYQYLIEKLDEDPELDGKLIFDLTKLLQI